MGNNDDPQSLHKYTYCHGDPVNSRDPTGLFDLIDMMSSVFIMTTLGALVGAVTLGAIYKANGGSGFRGALLGAMLGGALGYAVSRFVVTKQFAPLGNVLLQGFTQGFCSVLGQWFFDQINDQANLSNYFFYFDKFMTGFAYGSATAALSDKFGLEGAVAGATLAAMMTLLQDVVEALLSGEFSKTNWALVSADVVIAFLTTLFASPDFLVAVRRGDVSLTVNAWKFLEEGGSTGPFIQWLTGGAFTFLWSTILASLNKVL